MIADWLMKVISNMVLSHVISLLALLGLNFYIFLRGRITPLSTSYYRLTAGPFFWLFGKIVKIAAPTISLRWAGILIQYFGIGLIGPSFFIFCLTFFRRRKVPAPAVFLLYIPSLILFALIASNPLHYWFYKEFTLFRDSFGPVYYANTYTIYMFLAAGSVLLILQLVRKGKRYNTQVILFIIAAAVPFLASFYYPRISDLYSGLKFDITPVSFNLTFLCFGIAVFRYNFLDIPRIAHSQIIEVLPEGIIVKGKEDVQLYSNKAGKSYALNQYTPESGKRFFKVLRTELKGNNKSGNAEMLKILDQTSLVRRRNQIEKRTRELSGLMRDIQRRIRAEREILYINERIRTAQELHDILGHSLTVTIAQLEALKFVNDREEKTQRIKRIQEILSGGMKDLEHSFQRTSTPSGPEEGRTLLVSRQIEKLAGQCGSEHRSVHVTVKGGEYRVDADTARNIYSICRESITNAIRHGKADRIDILLDFSDAVSLTITDNGIGSFSWTEGTGILGIKRRAEQLKGSLRFESRPENGFSTYLSFSIK